MVRPKTVIWAWLALTALTLAGLAVSRTAMRRWAPDAGTRFPDRETVLATGARDAERLGYEIAGNARLAVSAGSRFYSSWSDPQPLVAAVADPAERRRLLAAAPPIRLAVRFPNTAGPGDIATTLTLEYDGDGRLVGGSYGFDGTLRRGGRKPGGDDFAHRLAAAVAGEPVPEPQVDGAERVYDYGPGRPGAYVVDPLDGRWLIQRQAVAYPVIGYQSRRFWSTGEQLRFTGLVVIAVLALVVLLWRLTRRRAGFGHAPVLGLLLAVGVMPAFPFLASTSITVTIFWIYFGLTQAGVVLVWTAGEAELRDVRPGAVEHWDRILGRRPLASTGRVVLLGFALGCGLGGLLAAAGRLAELGGGGYSSPLTLLPDYWTLSSPLSHGLALAAVSTLLVGFGGRVGGRPGAMVGAVINALCWSIVISAEPLGWSLGLGLAVSLAVGWIVWHHGLLAATVTCVTAFSFPTAYVGWQAVSFQSGPALVAVLPLLFPVLGLALLALAPRHGDLETVAPSYVSELEKAARLDGEVRLLRDFQLSLLPPDTLSFRSRALRAGLETAWRMIPADTVGGDFLDLNEDDDGRLWLSVADVAGHGISCSVLTAYTKAAVVEHATAGVGPAAALAGIRRLFGRLRTSRSMVTLLLAVWDPETRELTVATAGHPPLLVWADGAVTEVGEPGRPLGVELGAAEDREIRLAIPRRGVLVGYSDGVAETTSPAGETFTYERWPALLPDLVRRPARVILDTLLEAVDRHRAGRPAEDDVTAVVVKLA